jgi:predicted lipoprotein with Yx(FWY)xxD motif
MIRNGGLYVVPVIEGNTGLIGVASGLQDQRVIDTNHHEETCDMKQSTRRFGTRGNTTTRVAVAALVAGALATTLGATGASGAPHSHVKSVVIATYKSAKLGTILVDGTTLYTLKPNANACTSTCHKYWVEVLLPKGVTRATAGAGVDAAKLGSVKVAGGRQVTYAGKTLFWYFKDKSLGQVTGNVTDTWGKWADVILVKPAGAPTTTTTVSGGGGGVGF